MGDAWPAPLQAEGLGPQDLSPARDSLNTADPAL